MVLSDVERAWAIAMATHHDQRARALQEVSNGLYALAMHFRDPEKPSTSVRLQAQAAAVSQAERILRDCEWMYP